MNLDRDRLLTLLKYVVGIAALAWVVRAVNWSRALEVFSRVSPVVLLAVATVTLLGLLARFAMWHVLIDRRDDASFGDAINVVLVTNFLNNVLPSRISGRSIAPLVIRRCTGLSWGEAVAITGVHTGLFAITYGVVSTAGIAAGIGQFSPGLLLLLGLSTGLYLASGAFVLGMGFRIDLLGAWVESAAGVVGRIPRVGRKIAARLENARSIAERSTEAFGSLVTDPAVLAGYLGSWIVGLAIAPGLRIGLVLADVEGGIATGLLLLLPVYVVTAYSVTLLPVTPGGIGVAEATATVVFTALGLSPAVVVPVILIDRLLGVYLPALAGWYPTMRLDLGSDAVEEG